MSDIYIESIGGQCPVQAEGRFFDDAEFYFRSRGSYWSIGVGGKDPVINPDWYHEEKYSDEEYAAGWITIEEAMAFIRKAERLYSKWALGKKDKTNDR